MNFVTHDEYMTNPAMYRQYNAVPILVHVFSSPSETTYSWFERKENINAAPTDGTFEITKQEYNRLSRSEQMEFIPRIAENQRNDRGGYIKVRRGNADAFRASLLVVPTIVRDPTQYEHTLYQNKSISYAQLNKVLKSDKYFINDLNKPEGAKTITIEEANQLGGRKKHTKKHTNTSSTRRHSRH